MTYEWIEPKTNWSYRDKFTYTDYNRIRNNFLYINERINELFPELYVELDLGEPKTSYDEEYFPTEFNKFEDALISFERTGENYNLGERYYHYDNDPFVWEDVLNRLETCLLRWKRVDNVPVSNIIIRPHGTEHTLMFIGDSALFDVTVEPSNASKRDTWVLDNDSDIYVSKYLKCEKISNTQVRVTYLKGRGENAYGSGSLDSQKLYMVEDKDSLTDTSGYKCLESIYSNYIRVKLEGKKSKCLCHYLAQGSYTNRYEEGSHRRQYYKFVKIGDNIDGRGVTTFQMSLTDLYAMPFGYENRSDANAPWRKAFDGVHFWAFSKDLRDSMLTASKIVMSSATATTNSSAKFHLPSFKEFGSTHANVVALGSEYSYLANSEINYNGNSLGVEHDNYDSCYEVATRSLFNASDTTEEGLSSDKRKGLLSSRTNYINSFKPHNACGIFPLVFLPSEIHVIPYMDCYKIDWESDSSYTLAEIPLGSIVVDADGDKGDYSSYQHITSITLNKNSISMKETAVQTITITTSPLTAVNVQKLNVYTDAPDVIGLDYSGSTITVTGLKMGTGHIYVEADEFPNEIVRAVCNVEIQYNHIAVDSIVINEPTNPIVIWTKTSFTPETVQLTYTISPTNAKNKEVEWSSSDPSVATVNQAGLVTRVGHGTCTITVRAKDNNKTASRTVEVNYGLDSLSCNPNKWINPAVGATNVINLIKSPSYATGFEPYTYTSSDESVVSFINTSVLHVNSVGNATITVSTVEPHFNNNVVSTTYEVLAVSVESVQINEPTNPILLGNSTRTAQLTATVLPNDAGDKNVTWRSSNPSVATVSQNGLVTAVSNGTCNISVTTEDGNKTDLRNVKVAFRVDGVIFKKQSTGEVISSDNVYKGQEMYTTYYIYPSPTGASTDHWLFRESSTFYDNMGASGTRDDEKWTFNVSAKDSAIVGTTESITVITPDGTTGTLTFVVSDPEFFVTPWSSNPSIGYVGTTYKFDVNVVPESLKSRLKIEITDSKHIMTYVSTKTDYGFSINVNSKKYSSPKTTSYPKVKVSIPNTSLSWETTLTVSNQ